MDGKKDAAYFLGHLNNLPEPRARALRDLAAECSSRRMVALTVGELARRLGLATAQEDYLKDPLAELSSIRRYLHTAGIDFAPCGNPADVAFDDPLFITPKPVLTNDEDISAVARLARSRRAPTRDDFGAISRTNAKMNAYNVMLRVFENLCAVRSGQLGAAQLDTLNRIIGSLVLPLEGENYLRVCLSYASQVGVRHCDYKRPGMLYPPLAENLEQEVDECLARVFAASSYPQPLDQGYPRHAKLAALCARLARAPRDEDGSDPYELEREATVSFNRSKASPVQRGIPGTAAQGSQGGALFSLSTMSAAPGATGERLAEARGRISLLEHLKLAIPGALESLGERLRAAQGRIMQGLPLPGKIRVAASPFCKDRLIVRGDAPEGALLSFGIIPSGMDVLEYCKRDSRPFGLLQYLKGARPSGAAEFAAMKAVSAQTFFYALIAAPLLGGDGAFDGVSSSEIARAAADLFEESLSLPPGAQRPEIGAIYALHRTIIAPMDAAAEASDTALLHALHIVPGLLNAYVQDRLARASWQGGPVPKDLRIPCMMAALSEILRTSKPLSRLLLHAPGRPEFY
ncbi:MAG: hypothetical protein ACI4NA_01860, partial [Succinivibrio sp.]